MSTENTASQPCWWCGQPRSEESAMVNYELHKNARSETVSGNLKKVSWQSLKVPIPRCDSCRRKHGVAQRVPALAGVAGAVVAGVVIYLLTQDWESTSRSDTKGWMVLFLIVVIVSGAVAFFFGQVAANKSLRGAGTRPYWEAQSHPTVAELRAQGWGIGRPKT